MDLLFVNDPSHLDWLAEAPGERLKERVPVTGDLAVADGLERLGIPFLDEWDYLSAEDVRRNWEAAHELGARWWDEGLASTAYGGFTLAEAARFDVVFPFEICLNAATIYGRLLETPSLGALHAFSLPRTPVSRTGPAPLSRASAALAQGVLRWQAWARGRPLHRLTSPRPLATEGRGVAPGRRYPTVPDNGFTLGGAVPRAELVPETPGHVFWHTDPPSLPLPAGERVALIVENLQSPQELSEVEETFLRAEGWRAIRVLASDTSTYVAWPWQEIEGRRRLGRAWKAFLSFQAAYGGPHPALFANPYLRFQFRQLWADMMRAARLGESFQVLLDTVRPDVVVFAHEAFVLERTLVRLARGRGIPTAALIHGGFGSLAASRGIVGDADRVLVWWENDAEEQMKWEVDRERVRAIGSLRYTDGVDLPSAAPLQDERRKKGKARHLLGLRPGQPVVLFLTASINCGLASPLADPRAHRRTWHDLVELARRRPEVTFLLKPHPSYDLYEFYRQLCRDAPPNLLLRENDALDLALDGSDVAALVNYCTTAALEAMLRRIPVVFLRTAIYPVAGGDSLEREGALQARSVQEFEARVDELLRNEAVRRRAEAEGTALAARVIGTPAGAARERFLAEINALVPAPPQATSLPALGPEVRVAARLAEAARLLRQGVGPSRLLPEWQGALREVRLSPTRPRAFVLRALFNISCDIGQAVAPGEIRPVVVACFRAMRGDPRVRSGDLRHMLLNALFLACGCYGQAGLAEPWQRALLEALPNFPRAGGLYGDLTCDLAGALGRALHRLHALESSWTWKVGRLAVAPAVLALRVLRGGASKS
jgi:hypothetical protein